MSLLRLERFLHIVGMAWFISMYILVTHYQHLPPLLSLDKIYVVNLPFRESKWLQMQKACRIVPALASVQPERSIAVVGAELNFVQLYLDGKLAREAYRSLLYPRTVGGQFMTPGGLGCFLSHANLWRTQQLNKYDAVMILEDDVAFLPAFDLEIRDILDELPSDFGLVYFANLVNSTLSRKAATPFSRHLDLLSGEHWGTYAYLISHDAASILYDNAFPLKYQVDSYIIETCRRFGIDVYRTKNNLVTTDNSASRLSDVQEKKIKQKLDNMVVPSTFHVLDYLPGADKILRRVQFKKNGSKRLNRVVVTWGKKDAEALEKGSSILNHLRLKLRILNQHGGVIIDSNFQLSFPISKAMQNVGGFVGFQVTKEHVAFPILGFTKRFQQFQAMMDIINQAEASQESHEQATFTILERFQNLLSTTNTPNSVLIFPLAILQ